VTWDNVWPPNWGRLWSDVLTGQPWALIAGTVLSVLLVVTLVLFVVRSLRGKNFDAKASIGFGVVQIGVAYITITGGFEFFHRLLAMPAFEAGLLAGFIEACVWAAVGSIYSHGRAGGVGFGPAGGFFWTTIGGGGLLAILGSESLPVAIGRIVVVVLGAYMWYLRLLRATKPSGKPSRVRWTPKAFLLLIGAIVPGDDDVKDEAREWQVRKMARSMRWANSGRQPWVWLGGRALVKSAEQVQEDVLAEARRRYAAAHLLRTQIAPDSPVMAALLDSMQREALGEPSVQEEAAAAAYQGELEARLAAVEQLLPSAQAASNGYAAAPAALAAVPAQTVAGRRVTTAALPAAGRQAEAARAADAAGRAATAVAVPSTAATFRKWLTVWDDMQSVPSPTNAELAQRHGVAERTITNIRRAGKDGLLAEEHLQRLQGAETAGTSERVEQADAALAGDRGEAADRLPVLAAGDGRADEPATGADRSEPVDDAGSRDRREALVG
jgi:hypothetical protein